MAGEITVPAMNTAEKVREFCAAWKGRDIDELMGWFVPDAVYHNIPMPAAEGTEAIRGVLEMFVPMASAIEFEIRHLVADGNVVLTERVDHFVVNDRAVDLPVMGVFELTSDGKIAAWRDYFDLNQFTSQMS